MWFWLALSFALISSFTTLIYKVALKRTDEYFVALFSTVFNLPFLLAIILLFYQIPRLDFSFILFVLMAAILDLFAWLSSLRSLKLADISLVAPISAFNPVFTTFISLLVLREVPSLRGFLGILVIVVGAYLLRIEHFKDGLFEPFKRFFSHRGVRFALVASLIWAITPIFQKSAIFHTQPETPPFVSLMSSFFLVFVYTPLAVKKTKNLSSQIKKYFPVFVLTGFLGGLGATVAFTAFQLSNLGYVTAVFKLSMIFNVFWGHLFLKEKGIRSRLLGALIMFLGVLLVIS